MPRPSHASPQALRLIEALLAEPQRWRYGYDLSRETGLASGTALPGDLHHHRGLRRG